MSSEPKAESKPSVSIDHLFIKALAKAGVQFPASKAGIVSRLGDTALRLSEAETIRASSLVEDIEPESFENGSAFFCAFHSALYRKTYRQAFLCHRQAQLPGQA
jgi:hypothetical protein